MKKLLIGLVMSLTLLMVVGTSAFADEVFHGTGYVDWIQLYDGDPPCPCDLVITFFTESGQVYTLEVTAEGTQINLALLEAHQSGKLVSMDLEFQLVPFCGWITAVDFETPAHNG